MRANSLHITPSQSDAVRTGNGIAVSAFNLLSNTLLNLTILSGIILLSLLLLG